MRVRLACLVLVVSTLEPALGAQTGNSIPHDAALLVGRWRTVMNVALENSRASTNEPVEDLMEAFVSPGAVRAAKEKAAESQLQKADAALRRFVDEIIKASERRPDGSVVVEESAVSAGVRAICPVYPFCGS
jgi:hypothetical protein